MTIETILSVFSVLHVVFSVACVVHILGSRKRASATILWILVVIYLPWAGAIAYLTFGINTVRRRLEKRQHRLELLPASLHELAGPGLLTTPESARDASGGAEHDAFLEFHRLLDNVTGAAALGGNRCELMRGGEAVFAAMDRAMAEAEQSVHLMTYIIDDDPVGRGVLDRMAEKARRGVKARALVDGIGSSSFGLRALARYRRAGVDLRMMRQFELLRGRVAINLRNHRKLLICDGRIAFIGGMNISARHLLESGSRRPVIDYHARIEGPAVAQLQGVFAEDWFDVTSESVALAEYFPDVAPVGTDIVRTISGGPDHRRNCLIKTFCAAIQTAGSSIRIVTPYFVPDPAVLMFLQLAALGGVDTRVVLPSANNHPEILLASRYRYAELMGAGVRIYEREAPFSHSKLFLVDDRWACVGSANWDMRTFHLQFDTNVGVVSPEFVGQVKAAIDAEIAASRPIEPASFLPRPRVQGILERAASLFEDLL
jgi:cardiolipin synthase